MKTGSKWNVQNAVEREENQREETGMRKNENYDTIVKDVERNE